MLISTVEGWFRKSYAEYDAMPEWMRTHIRKMFEQVGDDKTEVNLKTEGLGQSGGKGGDGKGQK